jgi:hypothetical protein
MKKKRSRDKERIGENCTERKGRKRKRKTGRERKERNKEKIEIQGRIDSWRERETEIRREHKYREKGTFKEGEKDT